MRWVSFCILGCFLVTSHAQELDALIGEVFTPPPNRGQAAPVKPNLSPNKPNLSPNKPDLSPNPGTGVVDLSCRTEEGLEGECVQYYLCSNNNSIITDGVGLLDIRIRDGPCESYMEVCCQTPEKLDKPITPPPSVVPRLSGCGLRNPEGVGFRIKGDKDNEANFAEFPWMVAILREEPIANTDQKLNVYMCGGSLIHPSVVLTAAHCVVNKKTTPLRLKVRAGEWDTQTKNEIFPHQDRGVSKIVSHEHFYAGGLFSDIALLFLDSPVTEAENIGVVCLPPAGPVAPPNRCFASGWGKDVFGKEGKYQVILKKVELPIVERRACQTSLRKTRLGQHFELHRTFICAGGEPGKDTCKGDGGSPLVCPMPDHPDRYMQSGIVAWGIGCGENSTPGVYANVAALREWIDEEMINNNIDMEPFQI